jgi:hypothetical protein
MLVVRERRLLTRALQTLDWSLDLDYFTQKGNIKV